MSSTRLIRVAALTAAVLIVLAVAAIYLAPRPPAGGDVAIGGPFTLVDSTGAPVTEAAVEGKPYTLFFGFTYCPDVCPTALADLSLLIRELGPDADRLNYLFVTVDPERDTPEVMARYLESFDPHIRGLTGSEEQIAAVTQAYRAYRARVDLGDGAYTMDHTAAIYLMDGDGAFVGTISPSDRHADSLEKLRRLAAV